MTWSRSWSWVESSSVARRRAVDGHPDRRRDLFDRHVRRRRVRRSAVVGSDRNRWPAHPLHLAFAKRDQPGGGGEARRASGISRLSFFAKLRKHTSLFPRGPAT